DFTAKWSPKSASYTNVKFQAEYFHRAEDGTLTFDTSGQALQGPYAARQSGWYALGVYQFRPHWRVGARYDRLHYGTQDIGPVSNGALTAADFSVLAPYSPSLASAMIDWAPSEFSLLRFQYARDKSRPGEP